MEEPIGAPLRDSLRQTLAYLLRSLRRTLFSVPKYLAPVLAGCHSFKDKRNIINHTKGSNRCPTPATKPSQEGPLSDSALRRFVREQT